MRGLENGVTGLEVDVPARGHADTAHLGGKDVGDVVTVQVGSDDDAIFFRVQDRVLQECIASDGGEQQASRRQIGSVFALGHVIGPVHEGTLRIFHDIAVVDQCDTSPVMADRILDSAPEDPLGPLLGYGLHAVSGRLGETDFLFLQFVQQEIAEPVALLGTEGPFDAGIDIFGALPEHAQVNPFRILHG